MKFHTDQFWYGEGGSKITDHKISAIQQYSLNSEHPRIKRFL